MVLLWALATMVPIVGIVIVLGLLASTDRRLAQVRRDVDELDLAARRVSDHQG